MGTEGKLGGQAVVKGEGRWQDLTDKVNTMAANLTGQVRNIAEVTTAVARGDLSKKITADATGEMLELKNTINTMVDQLNSFASEVTRVAREVDALFYLSLLSLPLILFLSLSLSLFFSLTLLSSLPGIYRRNHRRRNRRDARVQEHNQHVC